MLKFLKKIGKVKGTNNRFNIALNFDKKFLLRINGAGNNNTIEISDNVDGIYTILFNNSNDNIIKILNYTHFDNILLSLWDCNNQVSIGDHTSCCSLSATIFGNTLIIGSRCMMSSNIEIWGDGHAVLDKNSGEILDLPKTPIIIGNHVWICKNVALTKNAQIPNNCIVGMYSVVTKKFNEEYSLIAGNPAKICKSNITFVEKSPLEYQSILQNKL